MVSVLNTYPGRGRHHWLARDEGNYRALPPKVPTDTGMLIRWGYTSWEWGGGVALKLHTSIKGWFSVYSASAVSLGVITVIEKKAR